MASMHRVLSLASFEMYRLFLTKRGALALVAFATAWFFILKYLIGSAATIVSSQVFKDAVEQVFGMLGISELLNWQVPELAIYWLVAVYSFPIFVLFAASDQTCADRTRGTLRFISLRATRVEIVIGRFLGQVSINTILVALTLIATTAMAGYSNSSLISEALSMLPSLFLALFIIIMPFVALMSFINSFIRSSRMALIFAMLFFGLGSMIVAYIEYKLSIGPVLNYIFPGIQINDMVNPGKADWGSYLVPIAQTLAYLLGANLIMARSSL